MDSPRLDRRGIQQPGAGAGAHLGLARLPTKAHHTKDSYTRNKKRGRKQSAIWNLEEKWGRGGELIFFTSARSPITCGKNCSALPCTPNPDWDLNGLGA